MKKFVIFNNDLLDLFKDKLIENKFIERKLNMCIEYKEEEEEEKIQEGEKIQEEENTKNENIYVLFTNNYIKKYNWESNVKLHNHIMNIIVFTDFYNFYLDFKKNILQLRKNTQ
jgi:hypothetical protein